MAKIKQIIAFILALLNFLFHFKNKPDDETSDMVTTFPEDSPPSAAARDQPLFETIP